jgi:hypothetical protein
MPVPQSNQSAPTTMMLLDRPVAIDKARLIETLRTLYPADCGDAVAPGDGDQPARTALLGVGGQMVALLSVDASLPEGWRQIAERSIHWPDAVKVASTHQAHLIISVMGRDQDPLARARLITAVAGAFVAAYPERVLAGLWGTKVINSAETWARRSPDAFKPYPHLPTSLWVSQHPFRDKETGGAGILTQGLSRFVGRELELTAPASDLKLLLDRAFGLTTYLIQNGPVLKDGSTFGISETEQIAVRLVESARFGGLPVISGFLSKIDRGA